MTTINARKTAALHGDKTYAMTKPCKRGHLGLRYTSCGICVQCANERQAEIQADLKKNTRVENAKKFEPTRVYSALVQPSKHSTMDALAHILEFGSPDQFDNCAAFIEMISAQVVRTVEQRPVNGLLSRTDLARLVDIANARHWDGSELVQDWDATDVLHIKLEGFWYIATDLKAMAEGKHTALRGKATI